MGYLLIMTAWSLAHPPGASPDEYAHYLRAMGVGRGDLVAERQPAPLTEEDAQKDHLRWQWRQTRVVEVPAELAPDLFNCSSQMRRNWGCPDAEVPAEPEVDRNTWVGTYPPYVYVVPGLLMGFMDTAVDALLAGRLASMLVSLGLLCLAVLSAYDPEAPGTSAIGPMLAVTPMVVFVSSTLTSSGPEIAAGASLVAGLLSLTRRDSKNQTRGRMRLGWSAAGLGAAILVLSRDLGPLFFVMLIAVVLAFSGARYTWRQVRSGGGAAAGAVLAGATALVVAVYWRLVHQVSPDIDVTGFVAELKPSLSIMPEIARQQIGVFGEVDTFLPLWVYFSWGALLASLGLLALFVGTLRHRLALLAAGLAGILLPVGVNIVQVQVGFGVQARQVMPFTIAIALLAGEVITRRRDRLGWLRRLRPSLVVGTTVAGLLGFSWYFNAKKYLVGADGGDPFWAFAEAAPPVPWELLASVTALGCLLVALSGHLLARSKEADRSAA